jgi:hypothetical protein
MSELRTQHKSELGSEVSDYPGRNSAALRARLGFSPFPHRVWERAIAGAAGWKR